VSGSVGERGGERGVGERGVGAASASRRDLASSVPRREVQAKHAPSASKDDAGS